MAVRLSVNQSYANDCSREIFFTLRKRKVIDQQWHAILNARFQSKWINRSDRIFLHLLLLARVEEFRVRESFGASSGVLVLFKKLSKLYYRVRVNLTRSLVKKSSTSALAVHLDSSKRC